MKGRINRSALHNFVSEITFRLWENCCADSQCYTCTLALCNTKVRLCLFQETFQLDDLVCTQTKWFDRILFDLGINTWINKSPSLFCCVRAWLWQIMWLPWQLSNVKVVEKNLTSIIKENCFLKRCQIFLRTCKTPLMQERCPVFSTFMLLHESFTQQIEIYIRL